MSIDGHLCFSCHRPAARFDRQMGVWVCEGNKDFNMSRNVEPDSEKREAILQASIKNP